MLEKQLSQILLYSEKWIISPLHPPLGGLHELQTISIWCIFKAGQKGKERWEENILNFPSILGVGKCVLEKKDKEAFAVPSVYVEKK